MRVNATKLARALPYPWRRQTADSKRFVFELRKAYYVEFYNTRRDETFVYWFEFEAAWLSFVWTKRRNGLLKSHGRAKCKVEPVTRKRLRGYAYDSSKL